jgi:Domain of unknown function (DUF6901)
MWYSLNKVAEGVMRDDIKIVYTFKFDDGLIKIFTINLNRQTLDLISCGVSAPPAWADLKYSKCTNCPVDESSAKYCPVALNLVNIIEEFKEFFSYENVGVTVTTEERIYTKLTSIQEGLSSLLGIVMVTSGCPVMEFLKPMVRFHLPFATLEETIFRVVSTYLISQHLLDQNDRLPDWKLEGLDRMYSAVSQVNRDFSNRLADASDKDANINALVNLDCFAAMIPFQVEEMLKKIEQYFSAYLK